MPKSRPENSDQLVPKSVKLPESWSEEIVKIIGQEMVATGKECTFSGLLLRLLDQKYELEKKTGVDASGIKSNNQIAV